MKNLAVLTHFKETVIYFSFRVGVIIIIATFDMGDRKYFKTTFGRAILKSSPGIDSRTSYIIRKISFLSVKKEGDEEI